MTFNLKKKLNINKWSFLNWNVTILILNCIFDGRCFQIIPLRKKILFSNNRFYSITKISDRKSVFDYFKYYSSSSKSILFLDDITSCVTSILTFKLSRLLLLEH